MMMDNIRSGGGEWDKEKGKEGRRKELVEIRKKLGIRHVKILIFEYRQGKFQL